MISIGKIIKPQGIKGEVKILALTSDVSVFTKGLKFDLGGRELTIKSVRYGDGFVFASFDGFDDRDSVESLIGSELRLVRDAMPKLPQGKYYIADMLGVRISDLAGIYVGTITNVEQFGSADVITAECDDKIFRFPFLNRLKLIIDIAAKTATIDSALLSEVIVYED